MKLRVYLLLFVGVLANVLGSTAQVLNRPSSIIQQRYKHTAIAIGGGSSHYFGELAPIRTPLTSLVVKPRWNGTVEFIKHNSPWAATKITLSWIRIAGNDFDYGKLRPITKNYEEALFFLRNLHFRNDIKELSVQRMFKIREQDRDGYESRDHLMPYLTYGLAFFIHNPMAKVPELPATRSYSYLDVLNVGNEWQSLRGLHTEGQGIKPLYPKNYPLFGAALPLGAGVNLRLHRNLDVNFEATFNMTNSKYLDDVSANKYPDPKDLLGDGTVNPAGIQPYQSSYPLSAERLMSNPSQVKVDLEKGRDRRTILFDIASGIPFLQVDALGYENDQPRGSSTIDSYLTLKVKLVYYLPKKIVCPPLK